MLELGNSKEVKDAIFRLRPNELSLPLRTDRGYVILSVKQIPPAHQGSLEEVREQVVNDLKQEESTKLAKTKADELAKRVKAERNLMRPRRRWDWRPRPANRSPEMIPFRRRPAENSLEKRFR